MGIYLRTGHPKPRNRTHEQKYIPRGILCLLCTYCILFTIRYWLELRTDCTKRLATTNHIPMSSPELHNQKGIHEPNAKLGIVEVCKNLLVTVYHNVKSLIYQAQFTFGKANTERLPSQIFIHLFSTCSIILGIRRYERLIPALLPF